MFTTKQLLLAAVPVFALTGAALATEGNADPFGVQGRPQTFAVSAPRLDLGSEAYPDTAATGAGWAGQGVNHVTREGVAAYQHGLDTGSESYPVPR